MSVAVLVSPVEALAFDYLSFGLLTVVNNVWTWVAVITAAVSVWRIRTSSPRDQCPAAQVPLQITSVSSSPVERVAAVSTSTKVEAEAPRPSSTCCLFNSEGRAKGKFTLYYDQEVEEDANVDDNGDVDGEDGDGDRKLEWWERDGWEVMMGMRMGDHMGFYRNQDLTVLDGNVVRLWDGCRRR